MDFGALPPEINSGRMYSGPGCGSMLAAAAAWDGLADDLHSTAASYQSVIWDLTGAAWLGPASVSMTAAAAPYIEWLTTTAALCEQTASNARAAAAAYEAAFAMTVPPADDRSQPRAADVADRDKHPRPKHPGDCGHRSRTTAKCGPKTPGQCMSMLPRPLPLRRYRRSPRPRPPQIQPGSPARLLQLPTPAPRQPARAPRPSCRRARSCSPPYPMHFRDLRCRYRPTLQLLSLLSPVNLAVASASTAITSTGMAGSYAGLGYAVHYDPDGASKMDAILERLGAVPGGSGTGALASLGSADLGAGSGAAPALSAGLGRASSIGALSVPPSWAAVTPPIRQVAAAWPNTLPGATPTVLAASPENLLNEMLLASMAVRGVGGAAPQGRPTITKTVTPRPRDGDNWG